MHCFRSSFRWIRRMLYVINIFLLLFLLIIWPFSHFHEFSMIYDPYQPCYYFGVATGRINLTYFAERITWHHDVVWTVRSPDMSDSITNWTYLTWGQFVGGKSENGKCWLGLSVYAPGDGDLGATIPISYLALLLLIWPVLYFIRWHRARQLAIRGFPIESSSTSR